MWQWTVFDQEGDGRLKPRHPSCLLHLPQPGLSHFDPMDGRRLEKGGPVVKLEESLGPGLGQAYEPSFEPEQPVGLAVADGCDAAAVDVVAAADIAAAPAAGADVADVAGADVAGADVAGGGAAAAADDDDAAAAAELINSGVDHLGFRISLEPGVMQ